MDIHELMDENILHISDSQVISSFGGTAFEIEFVYDIVDPMQYSLITTTGIRCRPEIKYPFLHCGKSILFQSQKGAVCVKIDTFFLTQEFFQAKIFSLIDDKII